MSDKFDSRRINLERELFNLINTGDRNSTVNKNGNNTNDLTQFTGVNSSNFGKAYAHALYPLDFESYTIAIELVNSEGTTVDFLSFPMMPKSISQTEVSNINIEKTMSGISVLTNPTFVPIDITLNGTFGKSFKQVDYFHKATGEARRFGRDNEAGVSQVKTKDLFFDSTGRFRTGFGCYKILEYIINKAKGQDMIFKPYKLYFYNMALGNNYLVEPISLIPSQNRESSNMMWDYTLNLRAIAPAEAINDDYESSLKRILDWVNTNQKINIQSNIANQAVTNKNGKLDELRKSKVGQILERQVKGRAMNLFNTAQQSAIIAMFQLAEQPNEVENFSLNVGEGLLNNF